VFITIEAVSPAGRRNVPNLFNETGHDSIDQRNTEAVRLIDELYGELAELGPWEHQFVSDLWRLKEDNNLRCSAKQLFKLRDLYEKYCI
jgi:hypothetical protein